MFLLKAIRSGLFEVQCVSVRILQYRGTEQKGMQIRVLQRRGGYRLILSLIVVWDYCNLWRVKSSNTDAII